MRTIRLAIVLSTALVLVASGPVAAGDARPMTGRFSATVEPVAQRCGPEYDAAELEAVAGDMDARAEVIIGGESRP
jgi:hypothetical protein